MPELRAYLDALLRDRERLAAATELDDRARTESTPSEVEIKRIRTLIRRVETDLEGLTDDEREQIKEATRTLRKTRTVSLGMPGVRAPEPDLRLDRDA
ncbi:transposase [Streptomyces sp. NPDC052109]|uniref:transposase n=1 Tax=Streptomyces sp. NPDC052109 TaxID=3155527 RepID=UPI00343C1618